MDPETRKPVLRDTLVSQLAREHLSDPLEEQEEVERNPEPDGVRKWMTRLSKRLLWSEEFIHGLQQVKTKDTHSNSYMWTLSEQMVFILKGKKDSYF